MTQKISPKQLLKQLLKYNNSIVKGVLDTDYKTPKLLLLYEYLYKLTNRKVFTLNYIESNTYTGNKKIHFFITKGNKVVNISHVLFLTFRDKIPMTYNTEENTIIGNVTTATEIYVRMSDLLSHIRKQHNTYNVEQRIILHKVDIEVRL